VGGLVGNKIEVAREKRGAGPGTNGEANGGSGEGNLGVKRKGPGGDAGGKADTRRISG